jgi:hypothetical protein
VVSTPAAESEGSVVLITVTGTQGRREQQQDGMIEMKTLSIGISSISRPP